MKRLITKRSLSGAFVTLVDFLSTEEADHQEELQVQVAAVPELEEVLGQVLDNRELSASGTSYFLLSVYQTHAL